jgi:transcriptional regulator with XRE-family HTH domain
MDIRDTFGANLRAFRLKAHLSQEALAERMGVDRAYISLIERGEQNVTILTLWHAAQALDIRPVDLLNEHEKPQSGSNRRSPAVGTDRSQSRRNPR